MILQQFLELKPGVTSYKDQPLNRASLVVGDKVALEWVGSELLMPEREAVAVLDLVDPWVRENVELPGHLKARVADHLARVDAYEARQEYKAERLTERASTKRQEADSHRNRSRSLVDCIPFGQPILIGHHSERGHRRRLDRSHKAMGKAIDLDQYASHLEGRAASVGQGGVSSDDPDGRFKLQAKMEGLVEAQERMKAANRAVKKGDESALRELGFSEQQAKELQKPDACGRVGFPSYALQNNNAEIRRLKSRIADLERASQREDFTRTYERLTLELDTADNRVRLCFSEKPCREVRQYLKQNGFNFSRMHEAWQRKATQNGICAAERAAEKLGGILQ